MIKGIDDWVKIDCLREERWSRQEKEANVRHWKEPLQANERQYRCADDDDAMAAVITNRLASFYWWVCNCSSHFPRQTMDRCAAIVEGKQEEEGRKGKERSAVTRRGDRNWEGRMEKGERITVTESWYLSPTQHNHSLLLALVLYGNTTQLNIEERSDHLQQESRWWIPVAHRNNWCNISVFALQYDMQSNIPVLEYYDTFRLWSRLAELFRIKMGLEKMRWRDSDADTAKKRCIAELESDRWLLIEGLTGKVRRAGRRRNAEL